MNTLQVNPFGVVEETGDLQHRFLSTKPLTVVRDIGFDNSMWMGGSSEQIFFVGALGETSYYTTQDALEDFIEYQQSHIQVVKDFLANGMNNNTNEWTVTQPVVAW